MEKIARTLQVAGLPFVNDPFFGDHVLSIFQYGKGRSVFSSLCFCLQAASISRIMSRTNEGYLKDLVQEKTGFPRYRLTLLLADGKSWEELGKPQEVQAVFNQVTTEMADELMRLGTVGLVRESKIVFKPRVMRTHWGYQRIQLILVSKTRLTRFTQNAEYSIAVEQPPAPNPLLLKLSFGCHGLRLGLRSIKKMPIEHMLFWSSLAQL